MRFFKLNVILLYDISKVIQNSHSPMEKDKSLLTENFCKGIFLFEFKDNKKIITIQCIETGSSSLEDFDIILLNSFPPNCHREYVYGFSLFNHFCYAYVFHYEGQYYSIVIHATKLFPVLYVQFLNECKLSFSEAPSPPDVRLDLIWSLIRSWTVQGNEFDLRFPRTHIRIPIDIKLLCFRHFSPNRIPPSINLGQLWHALLVRNPIFITASSPEVLTYIAFAVLSLIAPLPYRDNILLSISPTDYRQSHLNSYNVIFTLGPTAYKVRSPALSFFVTDLEEHDRHYQIEQFYLRTLKLLAILLELINNSLLINPYSDILNFPFVTDELDRLIQVHGIKMVPLNDFRLIENSWTIKKFRLSIRFRSQFRNAFLSFDPKGVILGQSHQHLLEIRTFLDEMINFYPKDQYLLLIAGRHKAIVDKLLQERTTLFQSNDQISKDNNSNDQMSKDNNSNDQISQDDNNNDQISKDNSSSDQISNDNNNISNNTDNQKNDINMDNINLLSNEGVNEETQNKAIKPGNIENPKCETFKHPFVTNSKRIKNVNQEFRDFEFRHEFEGLDDGETNGNDWISRLGGEIILEIMRQYLRRVLE